MQWAQLSIGKFELSNQISHNNCDADSCVK